MDYLGKRELIDFYNIHLNKFGQSPQALRWTKEGQAGRYQVITRILKKLKPETLLDFGCGFGDLYEFLQNEGLSVQYTGVDINERVIVEAKKRFKEARFICMDIEEETLREGFDAVVACGVFNLRVAGIDESLRCSLKKLYSLTRGVLIVDLLTWHQKTRDVQLNLIKPGEFLDFVIKELSSSVMLIHQYVDGAFLALIFRGRKLMENVI
jgi:SAM-dependent methyltransferase